MSKSSPKSQCALASKSNWRGVPQRRTSTFSSSSAPTGTLSCGILGSVVVNSVNLASSSAKVASKFLTSAESFCIAAILSSAFSLLRLAWAISAETVLRSALSSSTLTNKSRRSLSMVFIWLRVAASTPRVANFSATASKSVRMRFKSNIGTSKNKKHFMKLLERQSRGSIQLHKSALA